RQFFRSSHNVMSPEVETSLDNRTEVGNKNQRFLDFARNDSGMKWLLILAISFGAFTEPAKAEESLGTKIKKIFATPTPAPKRKHRKTLTKKATPSPSPTPSPRHKKVSPTPSPTATPETKRKHIKKSPTPSPEETPSPSPAETSQPTPSHPAAEKKGAPNVTLSPDEIAGYDTYPARVRQILDAGLAL